MELNLEYLMQKVSKNLHTIVRLYDSSCQQTTIFCMRKDLDDSALYSNRLQSTLIDNTSEIPFIIVINCKYVYACIKHDKLYFIIGPLSLYSNYSIIHSIKLPEIEFDITKLYCSTWDEFIQSLLDVCNLITSHPLHVINELDIVNFNCLKENFEYNIRKQLEENLLESYESGQYHNPYDQELRELSSIENGDIEALKKSIEEDYIGKIGTLAKDALRNAKNNAIVVITNSSRSAIRGGLSPEIAFSMSDLYIQQIEEACSANLPIQITRNAEFEFARMVHDLKKDKSTMNSYDGNENEHVMTAKNYIYRHLRGHITVEQIASALSLNANYLSGLFKKCEHISLKDFILNGKINLAKNMLKYSAYTYTEIAYYLGFSSQSHLGKQFKKRTGMTLSQYRSRFQMQEFMD